MVEPEEIPRIGAVEGGRALEEPLGNTTLEACENCWLDSETSRCLVLATTALTSR